MTQMINIVFSKMEAYSGNFGITLSKLQARNSLAKRVGSVEESVGEVSEINRKNSDKSLQISKLGPITGGHEEEKE